MTTIENLVTYCPECLRIVPFTSTETNLVICQCGKVIHRRKDGLLYAYKSNIISEFPEFIQPGTRGFWQDKEFRITGRIRIWYTEAVINYWSMLFDNGTLMLLQEGYGLVSVLEKLEDPGFKIPDLITIQVNDKRELGIKGEFVVIEKNNVVYWEIEGEATWPYSPESSKMSALSSPTGERFVFISALFNETTVYSCTPASFAELKFSGLRKANLTPFKHDCVKCNDQIVVLAYPYSFSWACQNCGTCYISSAEKGYTVNKQDRLDFTPDLPIGTKGTIKNIEYSIVGCAQKEEINLYRSKWREYTLFNPTEGFAFLSEFDGHWIFLRETTSAPVLTNEASQDFLIDKEPFALFNSYKYEVNYAAGEFPHNIFNNSGTQVKEFISPPQVWSRELDKKEGIRWFFGEHFSKKEVKRAFGVEKLPWQIGVGAVQPVGFINPAKLFAITAFAILILVMLNLFVTSDKLQRELFDEEYRFDKGINEKSIVTEKFLLEKQSSNLQLNLHVPLSNSWFELNATLVNADDGTEYSKAQGVEYYHGYTDGEAWSEGSFLETLYFFAVPKGNYYLQMQGIREGSEPGMADNFYVKCIYDVPNVRNLIVAILIVIIWATVKYFYSRYRENERWNNSPYQVVSNNDDDE